MATIDSLDIQISASAQKASQAIDILVGKLGNLSNALKIDTSKLENIGKIINLGEVSEQAKTVSENIGNMGAKVSQSMNPIQEQAKKAVKNLSQITEQYKDLGKGFTFSGDTASLKRQVDNYSNALEKAKLKKQELETSGKTEGQMYEYAVRDVLKYENILESLKTQLSSVEVPHIDLSALNQEELDNWFRNLPTIAQQAAQSINSNLSQIEIPKIEGIDVESLNYNASAIKAVFGESAKEIQNYAEAIAQFGQQAGTVLNQPIKTDLSQMSTKELDEWFNKLPSIKAEAERTAQSINNTLNQLEQPRSINISTESLNYNADAMKAVFGEAAEGIKNFQDAVQGLGNQAGKILNESTSRIQDFGEKLKNLEIPPIREENLKKLQSSLEKTETKLNELRANLANGLEMGRITESVDDKNYVKLQEQIVLAEKQAEALRVKIQQVEQQSKTDWARSLSNALSNVASFSKKAYASLSKINSVLKRLSTGLNKAVGKFMSLGKSLSHVSKSSKNSELSLSKAFRMVLRYGLGIRSVYTLINKLRRAIIEGFKNLALYSDEVNASISMLKSSFETLKNSSAAAMSPLLNAIAPALNTIIQLCVRATNAINQFLSAIFGKGIWIKAKDQVVDYADSLDKASGAADKLKTHVLGIDELNIYEPDDSGKGSGGTNTVNPDEMFETVPIESKFLELAEKVKKIFEDLFKPLKTAWDNDGKSVMDSWKNTLDEVWKTIKAIGNDFLTMWTQDKTVLIFSNILQIIKDIGDIVGNLAENFRTAWNTNEVGLKIFENIRDIIGAIVANIRTAADYTVQWSKTLDFYPLLSKIEEWTESLIPVFDSLSGIVTDFYTQVLLPLGKWTLEKGMPDLLQVFIDFNEKVDWVVLRANLSEFWKHLEPFAETVGEGLIIFIERVSDLVADFLNSDTFVNFLDKLENWMDSVTPEDVADGIEKLAKAFIAFKLSLLGFAAVKTVLPIITNALTLSEKLSNFGGFAFSAGATAQVFDVFKNTKEFGETQDMFEKTTLKIQELSEQLNTGKITLDEYNQRIGETRSELDEFTSRKFQIPGIEYDENGWNTKLVELKNKFVTWWNTDVKGTFSLWGDDISSFWNQHIAPWFTKEKWSELGENIKTGISTKWTEFADWWKTTGFYTWWVENVAPWFTFEKWYELGQGILDGLILKWEEIKAWWNESAIVVWWEEDVAPWFAIEKWSELANGIKEGIVQKWTETSTQWKTDITKWWNEHVSPWFAKKKWEELLKEIPNVFKNAFKNAANGAIGFLNGVVEGVEKMVNNAIRSLTDMAKVINKIPGVDIQFESPNISLPRIPQFKKGGITLSHTFAEISEFNKPEAILPLSDTRAMSMIADSIMENADYGYGGGNGVLEGGQIEEAVRKGVRDAVAEMLAPYLADIVQNTRETADKDMSVNLDGRDLINELDKKNQSLGFDFRTGASRGRVAF